MIIWASPVKRLSVVLALLLIMCIGTSPVIAGMLNSTPYALTYNATLWKGSVHVSGVAPFGTNKIEADAEFAVFSSPGFQNFMSDNSLSTTDPSILAALNAGDLIYAYQVTQVMAPTSPGATTVTVGLDNVDISGSVNDPAYVSTGLGSEQIPSATSENPSSKKWSFGSTGGAGNINIGEISPILVFSSRYFPEWDNITIAAGTAGHTPPLVASIGSVEIPEPASIALLISAVGVLLLLRRQV